MAQEQIKGTTGPLGPGGSLETYEVPGSSVVTPFATSVIFDGTGAAGGFLPCLTFKTITGAVIARCPAPQIAAGSTGEVSWFPSAAQIGSGGGGGGGGGSTVNVTDGITTVASAPTIDMPPASVSNNAGSASITLGQVYWVPPPTGVAATDNAAIQAGLNNVTAGGVVVLCPGTYAITGLTISQTLRLVGAGGADALFANWGTRLTLNSQTGVAINVTAHGVTLENFAIQNTFAGTPTSSSAGVTVVSGAGNGMHYGPNFSVRGFYINVDHQAGFEWSMEPSCFMYDFVHTGLRIQNVDSVDGGDMAVSGEFVAGPTNNGNAGIQWNTGGGLKLYSAKFNNRGGKTLTVGFLAELQDGVTTGDLLFSNCSIENSTYGILFENASGAHTAVLRKVVICGCQFDLASIANSVGVDLGPAAGSQLSVVNISGCTFSDCTAGIASQHVDNLSHGPNVFGPAVTFTYVDNGGNTNVTSVGNG